MYLRAFIAICVQMLIGLSCYSLLYYYPRVYHYRAVQSSPSPTSQNKSLKYVSLCHDRLVGNHRTGNQIFMLAAMLHIAKRTGRTVIMPRTQWSLDQIFDIDIARVKTDDINKELCPCERFDVPDYFYDPRLRNETFVRLVTLSDNPKTILLCGLSQTTRYTVGIEDELRKLLKIKPDVQQSAKAFMEQHQNMSNSSTGSSVTPFQVGVHIRRGDFLASYSFGFGLTVVDRAYLQHSFDYFARGRSDVQFIIVAQDWTWTDQNLPSNNLTGSNVTYFEVVQSRHQSSGVDLAILSMCDAVIMSTGSFGWWAAWLANKTTVYYKEWPRRGSAFERMTIPTETFPQTWIPLL